MPPPENTGKISRESRFAWGARGCREGRSRGKKIMLAVHSRKKLSISRQACEKNDPALLYVPESSRMQSSQQEVDDCVEGVIGNRIYREEFSKGGRMHHKHVSGHLGSSRAAL
jgi:hypothetical protein